MRPGVCVCVCMRILALVWVGLVVELAELNRAPRVLFTRHTPLQVERTK